MSIKLWLVASIFAASFTTVATAQEVDWKKVDDTFGRKPAVSGDVHRYGFPRTDLTVTLDGVTIKPALALGGWVAFKPMHGEAMVRSPPSTITCYALARPRSTCMSGAMAIPQRWLPLFEMPWGRARRRSRPRPRRRPRQPSISTPRSLIKSSASKDRRTAASINSRCRAVIR